MATAGVKRASVAAGLEDIHPSDERRLARSGGTASSSSRSSEEPHVALHHTSVATNWPKESSRLPSGTKQRNGESPAFAADSSLVLVGIRGSGKSTLAIMAATAMKRQVIDCEQTFQQATGISSSVFRKSHGTAEYHSRQAEVFHDILRKHSGGFIIVCSWMERAIHNSLREFARQHRVIHVLRDTRAIKQHLKLDDWDKARSLVKASSTLCRLSSNFEFFNVSETLHQVDEHDRGATADPSEYRYSAPYLTLKRAERHFLKFLSLLLPRNSIPFIESAFPLASIRTEARRFTYAMSIPLSKLLRDDFDIEDLETGADAIEIIVDDTLASSVEAHPPSASTLSCERAGDISRIIGYLRRSTVIPIIYHVVLPPYAEEQQSQQHLYLEYLHHGLRLAPEYVTFDLRLGERELAYILSRKGRSRIMAHWASPTSEVRSWHDPVWLSLYHRAQRQGCDIVRLIKPAAAIKDNFEVNKLRSDVDLLEEPHIPLIAYNSGSRGRHSACMNHVLTNVVPPSAASDASEQDDLPIMTAAQATSALYGSFLFDAMKLYVFGAKVDYSLSPAMHNAALEALGIPHHYRPHSASTLRDLKDLIEDPYFAGASVGLPFKVEVITLTHSLSRHARAIGAVNTLIPVRRLNPDGTIPEDETLFNCRNRAGPVRALYGDNTDWVGIRACIRRGLSPANAVRPSSCGLVIGAGGMARAAIYAMLQLGVKRIVVHNRTTSNAEKMVAHFQHLLARGDLPLLSATSHVETKFHVIQDTSEAWPSDFRLPTMIVFCIPIHSIGDVPAPEFTAPELWLESPTGGVLVDLGYKTLDTPILRQARSLSHKGWVAMDGLDLLPEQGFAQFELFTGRRAPRRLMRRNVLRAYTDEQGRSNLEQMQSRLNHITEQEP